MNTDESSQESVSLPDTRPSLLTEMRTSEDWWAVWCGALLLALSFAAVWWGNAVILSELPSTGEPVELTSPLEAWIAKPGAWRTSPLDAFSKTTSSRTLPISTIPGIFGAFCIIAALFAFATRIRGGSARGFLKAFPIIFLLATFSYVLAGQSVIKAYNWTFAFSNFKINLVCSSASTC